MINFLHNFLPDPVLFDFFGLTVHWYGVMMVIGGLFGFWLVLKLAGFYKLDKNIFFDLLLWWVIGAIIGARLYYVLYAWPFYQDNWLDIFKIWQGGLAVHGIILGGFLATYIYAKIKKLKFGLLADLTATGLVGAQIFGRVGNYFNQEIFGKPTDLSWGIPIEPQFRPAEFWTSSYFHPTFLYESLGNLVILAVILLLHYKFIRKKENLNGRIFVLYLVLYSGLRFLLEFLRLDYSPVVFGFRWAQILSFLVMILGMGFLLRRVFFKKRQGQKVE